MVAELRATISKLTERENHGYWKSKEKYSNYLRPNFGFHRLINTTLIGAYRDDCSFLPGVWRLRRPWSDK